MVTAGNSTARALATNHPPPSLTLVPAFSLLRSLPPLSSSFFSVSVVWIQKPLLPPTNHPTPQPPVFHLSLSEVFYCSVDFRSCFPLSLISVLYWGSVCAERTAECTHACVSVCEWMYVFETLIVYWHACGCTTAVCFCVCALLMQRPEQPIITGASGWCLSLITVIKGQVMETKSAVT